MRGRIEILFVFVFVVCSFFVGVPAFAGVGLDNEAGEAGWIMLASQGPPYSPPPIVQAAEDGDLEAIKAILKRSPERVNESEPYYGTTALMVAARRGDLTMVRFLVDKGAKVDACGGRETPLSAAARNSRIDIVIFLMDSGAELDDADSRCDTPLFSAARSGQQEMVRFLLEEGADPNAKAGWRGDTPLHVTEKAGIVKLLIKYGADVNAQNDRGETPLLKAAKRWSPEVARVLIEYGADVNLKTEYGATPLSMALGRGNQELARLLFENGADKQGKVKVGGKELSPLRMAVEKGQLDVVEALIEEEVAPKLKGFEDSLILFKAIETHPHLIRPLVEKGLYVNVTDGKGYTLLIRAVSNRKVGIKVIRLLIELGADVNGKDMHGYSALSAAMQSIRPGSREIALLLIENGADLDVYGPSNGHTPLMKAIVSWDDIDLARLILEKGASVNLKSNSGRNALHLALQKRNEEVARLLIENGVDVDAADKNAFTPLHVATQKGLIESARLLIEKGADVNVWNKRRDGRGYTPLLQAGVSRNYKEIARLLVESGADVNVQDPDGNTALTFAVGRGKSDIVALLIDAGADISVKNSRGKTLVEIARRRGSFDIVDLLKAAGAK